MIIILILRIILLALLTICFGVFGLLYCLIRPTNPSNTYAIARFYSLGLNILNIDFKILNKERLTLKGTGVYISNHQHNLDVFPMGRIVPKRTVSMGKKQILWIPFFGLTYWLSGNILINRTNKRKAWATMDGAIRALTKENTSVWIMPEGTRSKGRGVQRFKKGAFYAAIKAKVPIVPVAVSSYDKNLNLKKWRPGRIIMSVLPPIETKDLSENDMISLMDKCHKLISDEVERIDQNIQIL